MTDEFTPGTRKASLWQRLIVWGLFILFLIAFRNDLKPALLGLLNLLVMFWEQRVYLINDAVRQQAMASVGFTNAMLESMGRILLNVIIYILIYFLSIFIVAQFALPVRGRQNRIKARIRLFFYWLGWYGLTAFVREGDLIEETGEKDILNPGVVLVDLSSAVVLASQPWDTGKKTISHRSKNSYHEENTFRKQRLHRGLHPYVFPKNSYHEEDTIRIVGPGVNFIEAGEQIKPIIDLRRQVRSEPVKAITRDGIEIDTSVFTVFSVGEPPEVIPVAYIGGRDEENLYALELSENKDAHTMRLNRKIGLDPQDANEIHQAVLAGAVVASSPISVLPTINRKLTPYLFDQHRVFAAFSAGISNDIKQTPKWLELTQPNCIDLFQNMLSSYTFDRLFSLNELTDIYPGRDAGYNKKKDDDDVDFLKTFKSELSFKMRCNGVISYKLVTAVPSSARPSRALDWRDGLLNDDSFGKGDIKSIMSAPRQLTNSKVIRDHGIKVIAAGFTQIIPSLEIRRQVVTAWRARSERDIDITLAKHERDVMQVINNARTQVQRDNAYHLSSLFKDQKYSKEALALFLFQALENIATDPRSQSDLPPKEVLSMLQNLHRWLLIERKDMEIKSQKSSGHQGGDKPDNQPK